MSWSLPIPASPGGSSSTDEVGGRFSSPLAPLALWAVGGHVAPEWPRSTWSRIMGKATGLPCTCRLLVWGSDRQQASSCIAYPTPRGILVPRLNTTGLTPWERNNLRWLSTGKGFYRPGRKNLQEICIAIFQRLWERVQNNSLHWFSGAWGTIGLLLFQQSKVIDNMAAALFSASTPPFLLPCWARRQITHQRDCPWVAEIMKILRNWLHCLYKQHARSCLPLTKILFVGFLAFFFSLNACVWTRCQFLPKKNATAWSQAEFGLDSWEKL